jgi:hypothetical protein
VSSDPFSFWETVLLFALPVVLIPSTGLGITLLILAYQERNFLPYLESTSKAMAALGERPSSPDLELEERKGKKRKIKKGKKEEDDVNGSSIPNILGSAMWVGNMVPVMDRMTIVGRVVFAIILAGLLYLVAVTLLALIIGEYILLTVIVQIIAFAVFISPAIILFQWLTRDHDFYSYYSRRHQALTEVSAVGIPPVPDGKTPLGRFDTLLKSNPLIERMLGTEVGGVDKDVGRKGYRFSRFYHGTLFGERTGILIKEMEKVPGSEDLDRLLKEARKFGENKGVAISRVVALVTEEAEDITDEVYDHLIAQGKETRPGECALQLVMEVEGLYSFVPYVAM